jgi:hypothetical protein
MEEASCDRNDGPAYETRVAAQPVLPEAVRRGVLSQKSSLMLWIEAISSQISFSNAFVFPLDIGQSFLAFAFLCQRLPRSDGSAVFGSRPSGRSTAG